MTSPVPPLVSVIIVNWNGRDLLDACLATVTNQDFADYEVVVVDNGSADCSRAMVAEKYPGVRLLALHENTGFCYPNNLGIRETASPFVVLLNNDTEVERDWLRLLYECMASNPAAAACDSKVLYADRRDMIWSAGIEYSPAGTAHPRAYQEPDDGRWDAPCEVFGAVACAAMYRREALERVGLLDETFFAGYEDVDWSFRARLAGYRILHVPAARVYHKVSMTQVHNSESFVYRGQRNVELVYWKNMPASLIVRYGLAHAAYVAGSAVYFTLIGRGRAFWRAKGAALALLPHVVRERHRVAAQRRAGADALVALMDLDWWRRKSRKLRSDMEGRAAPLEERK